MYLGTTFNCYNSDKTLLSVCIPDLERRRNYYKTHALNYLYKLTVVFYPYNTNSNSCVTTMKFTHKGLFTLDATRDNILICSL